MERGNPVPQRVLFSVSETGQASGTSFVVALKLLIHQSMLFLMGTDHFWLETLRVTSSYLPEEAFSSSRRLWKLQYVLWIV